MAHAEQAVCPGCRKLLRFPANGLSRTFRCPRCGTVMRLRNRRLPASPPQPPALPGSAILRTAPYGCRKKGVRWGLFVGVFVLAAALAGAYLEATYSLAPRPNAPQTAVIQRRRPANPPTRPLFPRRVLAIAVNNYLYANPVSYGSPERNFHTLVQRIAQLLHVPPTQVIELSDTSPPQRSGEEGQVKPAHTGPPDLAARAIPPLKPVLEQAVKSFLETCRGQDRILLLFAGHILAIGEEAYLVPLEGELTVKETLIPLSWLYEQLARCKAREKVLILDTCRFDPGRGWERPGSGPMTAALDRLLQKPPAGVQLWSACTSGQYSYESDGRGIFLDKLHDALTDSVLKKTQEPQDPLPIDRLAEVVNATTAAEAASQIPPLDGRKAAQTPRLTGQMAEQGSAGDKEEPLPRRLEIPFPTLPAARVARQDQVQSILREVDLPPIKPGALPRTAAQIAALLPFSPETLARYRPDYRSLAEIEQQPAKYPLRIQVIATIKLLRATFDPEGAQGSLLEYFQGGSNEQIKAAIFKEQLKPARIQGELLERLEQLRQAGQQRDREPSRRWQAHYDYILAELLARTAYVSEYDLLLGKIRKDELPELPSTLHTGWRLASCAQLASGKEVKEMAALAKKLFAKVIKEHPGTPWEVLAKRARLTALGLEWQPSF